MRPQVVAHRGSSADAPEHTLDAYLRALADGADALECDVRLTADGHLVCVHDRRIDRTSDGRGIVSTMTLSGLDGLDFGTWYAEQREERRDAEAALRRPLRAAELAAQAEDLARRVRVAQTHHGDVDVGGRGTRGALLLGHGPRA